MWVDLQFKCYVVFYFFDQTFRSVTQVYQRVFELNHVIKSSIQKLINNGNTSKVASRLSPISRGNRTNPSIKKKLKNKNKNKNALFIVEVHLAIKLVYRHPTFNNVQETIET